jgi:DNA invertase Pin-like site-specific DNA recombinase
VTDAHAYVRVSSKAQSYETQVHAIAGEARLRGDAVSTLLEEKQSARTMDRPKLGELRAAVRAGHVRKLYVFKLDRLCRTGVADTFALVEELRKAGVELVAVADRLTIKTGSDDLTSEVLVFALGLAAKLERAATNDRIAAARVRLAAEGRSWGRPSRIPAFEDKLRALSKEGRSVRSIAMALGLPRATVHRAIARLNAETKRP